MSDLPTGWTLARARDLAELNPGNSKLDDDTIAGFVPMTMLGKDYRSPIRHEPRRWADINRGYTRFRDGDVLLAKITPRFEKGQSRTTGMKRTSILLLTAVLLGALGPAWLAHQQDADLRSLDARIAILNTEIDRVGRGTADLAPYREVVSHLLSRRQVVKALQARRSEALGILNFFAANTPVGTHLVEIRRDGGAVEVLGRDRGRDASAATGLSSATLPASGAVDRLVEGMTSAAGVFAKGATVAWETRAGSPLFRVSARLRSSSGERDAGSAEVSDVPGAPGRAPAETSGQLLDGLVVAAAGLVLIAALLGGMRFVGRQWRRRRKAAEASRCAAVLPPAPCGDEPAMPAKNPPGIGRVAVSVAFLSSAAAFAGWLNWPRSVSIDRLEQVESGLREDFHVKARVAKNQAQYRRRLAEMKKAVAALRDRLPDRFDYARNVADITAAAASAGVRLQSAPAAGAETVFDFFAAAPISLTATGTYAQVGTFLERIGRTPQLLQVRNFSLALNERTSQLSFSAELIAYRAHLDAAGRSRAGQSGGGGS